ncbi:MAG TPA: SDR family NAD(P)-dependent oxidoreductase, partial [Bradyrhizobium sp.]|nr:SDR family NAD(P)-dependent oxidoreductase [Bradyrhizobium sp.]
RKRQWYRQRLLPSRLPAVKGALYRHEGVYVVIGGAGGIGEAWSEYMIRTYRARIVWIGRRTKDATIQSKLDRLAVLGPAPHYIAADAGDRHALERAYQEIKQDHGQVHGVIHSAIVLHDKSLAKMEKASFQAALSAKVDVSVRLMQVFGREPLDFALFFSSMQSFSRSPGQSNYAAGSTFEDAFAHQLGRAWPCAVKVVNWGYWGSIGVVASKEYRDRMARADIGSLEVDESMAALEVLLGASQNQVVFLKATRPLGEDGGIAAELLCVYPQEVPSIIASLREHEARAN